MTEAQTLKELESLLERHFSPDCSNEERLDINKMLDAFSKQEDVWQYCVYFLQHSTNQYTLMYALHVMETIIVYRWSLFSLTHKLELRQFLIDFLIQNFSTLLPFIRNKVIHVVVLIGRTDWPHHYPDFINHIIQLTTQNSTMLLGLLLLKTTSEELATPKMALILSTRRDELLSLMMEQSPIILNTLVQILDTAIKPHSSPSSIKASPLSSAYSLELAPEICEQVLHCLNHLFSWIPLSTVITPAILETIFRYACLGCYSNEVASDYYNELGSLAMDCVNELLVKNCIPREFDVFLMKLFDQSFTLLQKLTRTDSTGRKKNVLLRLDERYLAKCADFFYWFVSSHLKRVEFNPHFPVLEFLALFYRYTFMQPEVDSFCVCLDTWGAFLDHLIMMAEDNGTDLSPHSSKHYERYKDILVGMTSSVLEKIQLHFNMDELREVDDDTIDDNETEWQSFLRKSLEFVGKVAELFPTESFQMIVPLLNQYSQVYLSLSQLISHRGKNRVLIVSQETQCESLHATLKDLTSVLQALGRLAEHFSCDHFTERLSEAQQLMNQFIMIARFSSENLLFNIDTPVPLVLEHDFIELHAQALGTLQAYQHWLSKFYLAILRQEQRYDVFQYLLSAFVEVSVPVISHEVPEKIALAACRLLISLAFTIRPHFLSQLPLIRDLLLRASRGQLHQLPYKVNTMIHEALVGMLILPWPNVTDEDQNWEVRYRDLCEVISGATMRFQQYLSTPGWNQNPQLFQEAKPEAKRTLSLLQEVIVSVSYERKRSKNILYRSISTFVENITPLFHIYLNEPDVLECLMGFFYTLFHGLLAQVGPALTERTTQTFMTLLTKEHLEQSMLEEDSVGNRVIEKFLNLLRLLVQNYSVNEKAFLPNIITFAMKQIYPIVATRELPEVKLALYDLLYQLLLNNWRYFFPSNVSINTDKDSDDKDLTLHHKEDFSAIMEAFGQSFLQSDINIFRQNLEALENLNEKHKLFSKHYFRCNMCDPFLHLLMQVLTRQSHDLLQEDITHCIFKMAEVDFIAFHTDFLSKFLGNVEGITREQQFTLVEKYKIVQDHPSFTQNLLQFTSDLQYFLTVNSVLPTHSVKISS